MFDSRAIPAELRKEEGTGFGAQGFGIPARRAFFVWAPESRVQGLHPAFLFCRTFPCIEEVPPPIVRARKYEVNGALVYLQ